MSGDLQKFTDPAFDLTILVQGFPGRSLCHGGLGWSTIALLRMDGRVVVIDTGAFSARKAIYAGLDRAGLTPADVTDVLLTHAHYDHSINWVLFPKARIHIGRVEMDWAVTLWGDPVLPELYVRALAESPQLALIADGDRVLPTIRAVRAPGHTPGCLVFVLEGERQRVLFSGDAAKNRAELVSHSADMTMDEAASQGSIETIWRLWRERPGTLLVPGHDLPMLLEDGVPTYVGERRAGVAAWYDDDLHTTTLFDFTKASNT
jgi:glyoxylase-like metal-dependent hydrolase (beta-lactamase superfamily II)